MFSKIIQLILVSTSMSPILLTFWFKDFSRDWDIIEGWYFLAISIFLLFVLFTTLKTAKNKLEVLPVKISEISNADNESIVFIFTYLIPLLDISTSMIIFLVILFFIILLNTNIYHFNPVLGILGYHQYEIKLKEGTSFILITKKALVTSSQIKFVVQLTNYILLEKEDKL
mgnify:FL=1